MTSKISTLCGMLVVSTLAVAAELKRAYLGIELNPEYEDLIRERLRPAVEFRSERSGFDLAMGMG
ncbi:hypothetical protein LCGC14_2647380 [marine sediment metagenome]|uniref:DNA methylase N-4/N-6 domain-containing protein n=1 Tax=marine sediment metagenome TaxID=412755 RepID=A0A0F9AI63_9ZZZZ